jgi:hypothetical protein
MSERMEREKLVEELARAYWDANRHYLVDPWDGGKIHPKQIEAVKAGIRAALSRLDALGLVVVPRVPTKEMILAGDDAKDECVDEDFSSNADGDREWYTTIRSDISSRVYAAMIAAATSSPQSQSNPSRS